MKISKPKSGKLLLEWSNLRKLHNRSILCVCVCERERERERERALEVYIENEKLVVVGGEREAAAKMDAPDQDPRRNKSSDGPDQPHDRKSNGRQHRHYSIILSYARAREKKCETEMALKT
jgi:hypothetical protein